MAKKLILDVDDATWKRVSIFKIKKDLRTKNDAVVELLKLGLTQSETDNTI